MTEPTPADSSAASVEPISAESTIPEAVAKSGDETLPAGEMRSAVPSEKQFYPLDPRSIRVEQLTGLLVFAVLFCAAIFGLVVGYIAADRLNWVWWTVAGGLATAACVLLFFVLAWPAVEFRHARWTWDESGLEIHRGVFWRHRITIPISRIQHVDVSQGPLQRQYGLGKVTVHTAGTQHAAIELSGISYEAATWLREQIIAGQGAQDAV